MANEFLAEAKRRKNDEFYTQFSDIQKKIHAYIEYNPNVFRDKVVYCNCDDPFESNFFRYFALNFKPLGLKQLITTSYSSSHIANTQLELFGNGKAPKKEKGRPKKNGSKVILNEVKDIDGDGEFNLKDVALQLIDSKHNELTPLVGTGDFRSEESINLLKQSDIVVTNPPFSLFREYIKQLVDFRKKFLIIGHMNAIAYKEVFPLLKENKVWLGNNYKVNAGAMLFAIPEKIANRDQVREVRTDNGVKTYITRVPNIRWFTNINHGRRHEPLQLMTEKDIIKFSTKHPFVKYDNYDAIEISHVKNIPRDYKGVMGVPVSLLDRYNPDQFEIIGNDYEVKRGLLPELVRPQWTGKMDRGYLGGKRKFARIFIRNKNPERRD